MSQAILATANQIQSRLEALIAELPEILEQQQKLVDAVEKLTKENEKLRIQLQQCQINSAKFPSRSRAKTFRGISIE